MSKKIKKLIKTTRHRLTWPVRECTSGHTLMITSDHQQRSHLITIPQSGVVRPIEYLHELAHATLCEQVHPQFSTQYFNGAGDERVLAEIQPAAQAASDWFADAWLMAVCPIEERREIEEHCALVVQSLHASPAGTPEMLYGSALMIAQAKKYCSLEVKTGGQLLQAVTAFLSIEPSPPTIEHLEALLNLLLEVLHPYRVRLEDNEWRVVYDDNQ